MTEPLQFVVPGPPVGKERARSASVVDAVIEALDREWHGTAPIRQIVEWLRFNRSRLSKHYTPKKTKQYEKHVRSCAEAELLVSRAKGWPTSKQVFCDLGIYHATAVRPDPDNVVKAISDALTGVLWKNDRNVLCRPMVVRWPASEYSPVRSDKGERIPCVKVSVHETGWEPDSKGDKQ